MTLFRGSGGDLPLMPWLEERIWPVEAKLEPEDVYWGTRLACLEMIRSGTTRFWDMYWHPEATARAVADAGLRATIGAPMFDKGRDARAAQDGGAREPRDARRRSAARSAPRSPRTRSTWSARSRCASSPSSPPSATRRSRSTSPRRRPRSRTASRRHGLRPAAYLDRPRPADRAHPARPRRLARRRRAGAGRRARRDRRLQPGGEHETRGRQGLRLSVGASGRGAGRPRHRRRRVQRLARPARRPEALRPRPAPRRRRRDRDQRPTTPGRSPPARAAPLLGATPLAPGEPADFLLLDPRAPELAIGDLAADLVYAADRTAVDTVVVAGQVLMRGGVQPERDEVVAKARERATRLGL